MAIVATNVKYDATGHFAIITGDLGFAGAYPGPGGDPFNLTLLPGWTCGLTKNPISIFINGPNGYTYGHAPALLDASAGTVPIFDMSTGAELAAAAYPATVSNVKFLVIAEKS